MNHDETVSPFGIINTPDRMIVALLLIAVVAPSSSSSTSAIFRTHKLYSLRYFVKLLKSRSANIAIHIGYLEVKV